MKWALEVVVVPVSDVDGFEAFTPSIGRVQRGPRHARSRGESAPARLSRRPALPVRARAIRRRELMRPSLRCGGASHHR